ncbi:MAG TPA: MBL fold metallo-hydrolase [Microthrixaceae bacterium]|nr:MBL fold metallo-hydrolase [Microthrixaceae bacterium]
MSLAVTVLGCSGTYAAADNACSGYLVQADGFSLLADCGPGSLSALQRHIDLRDLDAIVLSHSHPDHWLELPVLRNALLYVLGTGGIPVYGTEETLTLAEVVCHANLNAAFGWSTIHSDHELRIGPLDVRFSRTQHPPETLAMRFDHGDDSVAYSADTGPGWSFAELGDGIDLAICEATYLHDERDRSAGMHLSATEAGEIGRSSGVGSLVLTHLVPGGVVEEYRREGTEAYGAPVDVATPGATFRP